MRVSVGDIRLFFEVSGDECVFRDGRFERSPVVIGLHGGPALDGTKLRFQLAPLAQVAQVVVPDQRGHGRIFERYVMSVVQRSSSWADLRGLPG